MRNDAADFKQRARTGLENPTLRAALLKSQGKFVIIRRQALADLGNEAASRRHAAAVRDEVLQQLDRYLERFETEVTKAGGTVLWAEMATDAQRLLREIATRHRVRRVVKSKSMVTEECALNEALADAGIDVAETDLGEYILQLAGEPPSHIVAPVVHKTKEEIARLFEEKHGRPRQHDIAALCREAREVLRPKFLMADMGITGANFAIAETGSVLIVTNEGNGRLTTTLPRVHVALTGIEKVVPTLEDAALLLRLLTRSATGQPITNYVSLLTGPKRSGDTDGPEHFYVILLDNGRSQLLGGELQTMLRCIRCGACMNHCPVYQNVGGHAYGWVYPGPMGAVLTPSFVGLENARDLPDASTLCGACSAVCPVNIPLPDLLRTLRVRRTEKRMRPWGERAALKLWSWSPVVLLYIAPSHVSRRDCCIVSVARKTGCTACPSAPAGPTGVICPRQVDARSASYTGKDIMNSRDTILARVRQGLGRLAASVADRTAVETRIVSHARGPLPTLPTDLVACFADNATRLASTVTEPPPAAEVPVAVTRYLTEQKLSRRAVCWPGLTSIDWKSAGIEVEARLAREDDLIGITGVFCAIAETGTLMLLSGPQTPPTVSLLPETHIALLPVARIVAHMEDGWDLLRQEHGSTPRAVNFISGPSRTADIEQTVTLGAHGPYRVHIVLLA